MKYKATSKINKNIECNSMIVTSSYIIACQDKRLHCFNFSGEEIRIWFVLTKFDFSFLNSMIILGKWIVQYVI